VGSADRWSGLLATSLGAAGAGTDLAVADAFAYLTTWDTVGFAVGSHSAERDPGSLGNLADLASTAWRGPGVSITGRERTSRPDRQILPPSHPPATGGLPTTGTDVALLLALAGAAIAAGAGALVVTGRVHGRKLDRASR
jgi:hypothetical protein